MMAMNYTLIHYHPQRLLLQTNLNIKYRDVYLFMFCFDQQIDMEKRWAVLGAEDIIECISGDSSIHLNIRARIRKQCYSGLCHSRYC